jgi:hypothetical protein
MRIDMLTKKFVRNDRVRFVTPENMSLLQEANKWENDASSSRNYLIARYPGCVVCFVFLRLIVGPVSPQAGVCTPLVERHRIQQYSILDSYFKVMS